MKKWNLECFGDLKVEKRRLMGRLEVFDKMEHFFEWSNLLREEIVSLKYKLQELIFVEERSMKQKSKFKWAKAGNVNSKLFHKLLNARKSLKKLYQNWRKKIVH